MIKYKPSAIVRISMHAMSALMILVILILAAMAAFFILWAGEQPPWLFVGVGGGVCLLFVVLNSSVASMRLIVEEDSVTLKAGLWGRKVFYKEAELKKEIRPVGLTAVRMFGKSGKKLYLNPAWFNDFDRAMETMETRILEADGVVEEERIGGAK